MRRIVTAIVTLARPGGLDRLLQTLGGQQLRADATIVVENLPRQEMTEVLARHPAVRHLINHRNLGGAGGFAYGILAALAYGATHVWLMDDDGLPRDPDCLRQLTRAIEEHEADVVAPLILDIEDEQRLAFTYFVEGRRITTRDGMAGFPLVRHFAHLFNGTLARAEAFARFGIPNYRLFMPGDEIDFLHRVRRGGGLIMTMTDAGFRPLRRRRDCAARARPAACGHAVRPGQAIPLLPQPRLPDPAAPAGGTGAARHPALFPAVPGGPPRRLARTAALVPSDARRLPRGFPSHGAAGGDRHGATPATRSAVRKSAPRH